MVDEAEGSCQPRKPPKATDSTATQLMMKRVMVHVDWIAYMISYRHFELHCLIVHFHSMFTPSHCRTRRYTCECSLFKHIQFCRGQLRMQGSPSRTSCANLGQALLAVLWQQNARLTCGGTRRQRCLTCAPTLQVKL